MRRPLRWKIAVLLVVLVSGPLVGVGLVLVDVNRDAVGRLALEVQLAVAEDVSRDTIAQLSGVENALESVGRALARRDLPSESALAAARAITEGSAELDHVAVYDVSGTLIDVVRERAAVDVEVPEVLLPPLRDRATANGSAVGDTVGGDLAPRVLVVVPIRPDPAGAPTGFTATSAKLARLAQNLERSAMERFPGVSDAIVIVDHQGRPLVGSVPGEQDRIPTLPWVSDLSESAYATDLLHQGEREVGAVAWVASLRTIPRYRWAVVIREPRASVFASVDRMRAIVAGTVLVALSVALVIGLWFARRMTQPFGDLTSLATDLGERRFGRRVSVTTSDELATLAESMSDASVALKESEERLREEEAIRGDLRRYLPAEIVDRIDRREQSMSLGGERREITVLFADVVGFTPLTESLAPEQVVTILNELFTILTEIVFRHEGLVDKFIGDCVMAFWGAPEDQPDQTHRAVAAAEEMLRWLETGNLSWKQRFGVTIQLAIGIHRGEAIVGNVGSETRMTYTAIGDVVNVAARLEAIARPQQILVTREVQERIDGQYECVAAGSSELAGRRTTMNLFEVRG